MMEEISEYQQRRHEGIAFAKPTYPLVQAWRYQIWYGPIKTIQKDDLQSVTADVESLRQAREEQQ